jgi:signal transduction histidine kinase/FixJ family two-component response regulator
VIYSSVAAIAWVVMRQKDNRMTKSKASRARGTREPDYFENRPWREAPGTVPQNRVTQLTKTIRTPASSTGPSEETKNARPRVPGKACSIRWGEAVSKVLRILIVEDSPTDAELVVLELARAGLYPEATRVETPEAFAEALDRKEGWDAVIADYRLPGWSGLRALNMMQERAIDLPFIIVSGAIGEETAVDAMKAGAHDYVLKDNVVRLVPAIERERREAGLRRERRQALASLEQMAQRSAVLAAVSGRLAGSLDYDETLEAAARVCVPEIADWCVLAVLDEEPRGVRAVLWHVDPGLAALGRDHLARHGLDLGAQRGAAEVVRTGTAVFTTLDSALVTLAGEADRKVAAQLGHGSGLTLPLDSRSRRLGALTLVRTSARAPFLPEDLAFAQELAARIAMALDSAQLYRQAKLAIIARDEFLSVASHELNTPLTTLRIELENALLMSTRSPDRSGPLPADPPAGFARARRQLDRLSRLVASLLDISRARARGISLDLSSVDLSQTAREVVEQFGPELGRLDCAIDLTAPAPVVGRWDALRMAQMISNLLSNACKYGAGKPIQLQVEPLPGRARVTVVDHGIGIPPGDLDRIFQPFERAVSFRHYGGLGLGLYITRQVVEAHGGTIRVQSELGQGSTFVVELPLERSYLPESPGREREP